MRDEGEGEGPLMSRTGRLATSEVQGTGGTEVHRVQGRTGTGAAWPPRSNVYESISQIQVFTHSHEQNAVTIQKTTNVDDRAASRSSDHAPLQAGDLMRDRESAVMGREVFQPDQ